MTAFPLHPRYEGREPKEPKLKKGDRVYVPHAGMYATVAQNSHQRHEAAVWSVGQNQTVRHVHWLVWVKLDNGFYDQINATSLEVLDDEPTAAS